MNGAEQPKASANLPFAPDLITSTEEGHRRLSNCELGYQSDAVTLGASRSGDAGAHDPADWLEKPVEEIDNGFEYGFRTPTTNEMAKRKTEEAVKDEGTIRVGRQVHQVSSVAPTNLSKNLPDPDVDSETIPLPSLNENWENPLDKETAVSSDGFMARAEGIQAEGKAPKRQPFNFVCAFGFTGKFDAPSTPPSTKDGFLSATTSEISKIGVLQSGMQAYQREINSRKHYTFSTRFLVDQNTAIIVTLSQLDQIIRYIKQIQEEVELVQHANSVMEKELLMVFHQAQSWVARARAILIHSHVFYKINFVLADEKTQ